MELSDLLNKCNNHAFGRPGITPKWTHGDKEGVGTSYSLPSKVWYTLWRGIITEVYYPHVDSPQIRDIQFLISDGKSFFHEEKRHLKSEVKRMGRYSLGYTITNRDPENRYTIEKEIIADPHLSSLIMRTTFEKNENCPEDLTLYLLLAPHLNMGGTHNNGFVTEVQGKKVMVAFSSGIYMAVASSSDFSRASCGFVGSSDGWTDISRNLSMTLEFNCAIDGNIAFTGQIPRDGMEEFTVVVAFGNSLSSALTRLFQTLSFQYSSHRRKFIEQWMRTHHSTLPLDELSHDGGNLYRSSISIIMAHEDKTFEGAVIASLSIPWGEIAGDENRGGYHLVWNRDLYHASTAILAVGKPEFALRSLIYLSNSQMDNGGFPQNFWIDGTPYWHGIQLDETAFPVILAWRLWKSDALGTFDPFSMIKKAVSFLIQFGPVTQEERWEEASGFSPSTLAATISALVCASDFFVDRGNKECAKFILEYADFLESHLEKWCVTNRGTLVDGIKRHYIRILPEDITSDRPNEDPDSAYLKIANLPEESSVFPAREIIDAGFLELVRYGIRSPDDPLIVDSLKVVDEYLKVDTPQGPVWRRYNHDGYGQKDDGSPYDGTGTGRAWPLLTGERGHYELSRGKDVSPYIKTLENFSSISIMLCEQVWDKNDMPEKHLFLGKHTGSARPLIWAHAEYIKLLRSARDGKPFDRIEPVYERYVQNKTGRKDLEIWKFNRKIFSINKHNTLRIQAGALFILRWTSNSWVLWNDTQANDTGTGIWYVDITPEEIISGTIEFTFYWPGGRNWEGRNFSVVVE
ncbi:MAG: glycoside hydrolase family 15 protein [Candidatus Thermoplasmatota archaeon]|nr:glycoside hydrolase family 15 protein [Candidatus Thermoplasmatota archaeon]MCL5665372.1 glycoside hydrolase family 15 protein [Candidatus Thermoplasmatota archaeon]